MRSAIGRSPQPCVIATDGLEPFVLRRYPGDALELAALDQDRLRPVIFRFQRHRGFAPCDSDPVGTPELDPIEMPFPIAEWMLHDAAEANAIVPAGEVIRLILEGCTPL